jgi:hypothetical protein
MNYKKYLLIIQFKDQNSFQADVYLSDDEFNTITNVNYSKLSSLKIPLSNRNDPSSKYGCITVNLQDVRYIILELQ